MSSRSILILTSAHLCRNPRVVKEAQTLGEAGYDVTVLTISGQARFEQMDLELMRGRPFARVTLDYAGTSAGARGADFFQRSRTWAARKFCQYTGIESAQALGPAAALLRRARALTADLTIVHTEIPLWTAQPLMADGRRVAVDIEDWYSEDLLHGDRRSRPLNLLRRAESYALQHAAYSSATSASMADALQSAYHCPRPIVLRNSFPRQLRTRLDWPATTGVPALIWFSQTVGPGRGLELFQAAWLQTRHPSRVYLLGDQRPGYREKLLRRLPPERRSAWHFLPLVSPAVLPATLAEFDIGLALERSHPRNRDLAVTNKILQYLNAGLAVVATDTSGQKEVLASVPDAGVLVTAHETSAFAEKLDGLIGDHARLRRAQEAARAAAAREFTWEHDAPKLLHAVEGALDGP